MEDSSLKKIKLTVAQAIIQYLNNQYIDVDGNENKFFSGCFGILGHGNVAGIGQAIQEQKDLKYYQFRKIYIKIMVKILQEFIMMIIWVQLGIYYI